MKRLALDTNAYRALDDGVASAAAKFRGANLIGMPIIVLGELYHSIERGSRRERNMSILRNFLANPRVEILHINEGTAKIFGEISTELANMGRPIQQNDVWIAALAKQYDFPLLTADKGFDCIIGLEVIGF